MRPRTLRVMLTGAFVIGLVIAAQGVLGLAFPDAFVGLVRWFQQPPVLYLAALVRVAFGAILFAAAPGSRLPRGLRALGALIVVGGLATPFIGLEIARVVLGWWTEGGAAVVRAWALLALGIAGFILYAVAPTRRASEAAGT